MLLPSNLSIIGRVRSKNCRHIVPIPPPIFMFMSGAAISGGDRQKYIFRWDGTSFPSHYEGRS